MDADLLIHSASQVLTFEGGPQRGMQLGQLGLVERAAVAISSGEILAVGPSLQLREKYHARQEVNAGGNAVLPGFIDPHTHPIWMGDRAGEFELRIAGASYMEILAAGGGILSTVRHTRAASVEQLKAAARPRLRRMLAHGTTTAEAKTGYGLDPQSELRQLQAILELDAEGPLELVPTYLGAHAIPEEFLGKTPEDPDRSDAYVELLCRQMLPGLQRWWREHAGERPPPFVDVFCEAGAFDLAQTRRILEAARDLGFPLKLHADEFESLGGTALAVEFGAVSADHLVATPPEEVQALGGSDTVAVALPSTPFGLGHAAHAPAAEILRAGGILALASDLNPGTAWCESMQFVIALACRSLRLTPAQAVAAATINAAFAVRRHDRLGSLEPGKQADLIVLNTPDYHHLGYRFGTNLVQTVVKGGRIVWEEKGDGHDAA